MFEKKKQYKDEEDIAALENVILESIRHFRDQNFENIKSESEKIQQLLHMRTHLLIAQSRSESLGRIQKRMKEVIGRASFTHSFIIGIATVLVIFGAVLFGLMVKEALTALESTGQQAYTSISSVAFGGLGVADIFILMKYVMNRAQRALSEMVQTLIVYHAFRQQTDMIVEYFQHKGLDKVQPKELETLDNYLGKISKNALESIQKFTKSPVELDSDKNKDQNQKES